MLSFDWAFSNGDKIALDLDYVPMPQNVKGLIRQTWGQELKFTN